jgi:hypothetical protein
MNRVPFTYEAWSTLRARWQPHHNLRLEVVANLLDPHDVTRYATAPTIDTSPFSA